MIQSLLHLLLVHCCYSVCIQCISAGFSWIAKAYCNVSFKVLQFWCHCFGSIPTINHSISNIPMFRINSKWLDLTVLIEFMHIENCLLFVICNSWCVVDTYKFAAKKKEQELSELQSQLDIEKFKNKTLKEENASLTQSYSKMKTKLNDINEKLKGVSIFWFS